MTLSLGFFGILQDKMLKQIGGICKQINVPFTLNLDSIQEQVIAHTVITSSDELGSTESKKSEQDSIAEGDGYNDNKLKQTRRQRPQSKPASDKTDETAEWSPHVKDSYENYFEKSSSSSKVKAMDKRALNSTILISF